MKVNGYTLREVLRTLRTELTVLAEQLKTSLWYFEGQEPQLTLELSTRYETLEKNVATLETAQQFYNFQVRVEVKDLGEITLAEAVKLIGSKGRLTKIWRSLATSTGRDKFSYRDNIKNVDDEFAKRTLSIETCMKKSKEVDKLASNLRTAIAIANSQVVDILFLSPDMLE